MAETVYFLTGVELLLEGVAAEVLFDVPPLFFDGFFDVSCFFAGFAGLLVSVFAGVWANVKGMVPNANAIASRVVFIEVFSPWRACLPAYNSMVRRTAKILDSPRGLCRRPKWHGR